MLQNNYNCNIIMKECIKEEYYETETYHGTDTVPDTAAERV